MEDEEAEEENLEPIQSPTVVGNDHNSKFFKLPKALEVIRKMRRIEALVDYSQFHLLTSNQHISSLEEMAARKERIQSEKEQKLMDRELNKAKKAEERELNKIQRVKAKEANEIAKDLKATQQTQKKSMKGKREDSTPNCKSPCSVERPLASLPVKQGVPHGFPSLVPFLLPRCTCTRDVQYLTWLLSSLEWTTSLFSPWSTSNLHGPLQWG